MKSESQQKTYFFALVLMALIVLLSGVGVALPAHAATNNAHTYRAEGDSEPLPICEKGAYNPDGTPRTYQDYALCMAGELDHSLEAYHNKDYDKAYDFINEAYFGWYENNLEPQSMALSGNRKVKNERRFSEAKKALKDNPETADLDTKLKILKAALARDAMVLDGVISDDAPEKEGLKLLKDHKKQAVDSSATNWVDFVTSLTLLLREGLEAMLVVVAIVLYLVKAGQKKLARYVYWGAGAAIVLSFILAWIMKQLVGGASQASELLEGATMFLAVAMLFYVSNWMLSKTSGENWSKYIQGMVKDSVSTGAAFALIFAAFLAVLREGAELVLFYTAAFSGAGHNSLWIGAGFLVGVLILAVIFVIFRWGGARLPVRPIFFATSILLFVMCISFVGKGVQELREADVIQGSTNLPWVKYYIPDLGIFPQAETLLPQLIIFIAAVWVILAHWANNRRYNKEQAAIEASSEKETAEEAEEQKHSDVVEEEKSTDKAITEKK